MRKNAAWIVALGLVFSCYSFAGEYTVFGPKQFSRGNGTPVTETVSFASPVTGSGFKLKANNGEEQGAGRTSSGTIALNGEAVANPSDFNQQVDSLERIVPLASSNNLSVQLNSQPGSSLTLSVTGEDNDPPDLAITAPENGSLLTTASVDVVGTVVDGTPVSVNVNGMPVVVAGQSFSVAALPLAFGENRFTASATDLGGNTSNYSITVIRKDITPPQLAIITPAAGSTTEEETIAVSGTVQDDSPVTVQVNGLEATVDGQVFSTPDVPLVAGSNNLIVTATDAWGNTTSLSLTVIRQLPRPRVEPQPVGSFGSQYQDLIPADATKTTYDPKRFALITGEVKNLRNEPIPGVTVSVNATSCVQCHGLEYGSVKTDANGKFTIPTEGGSSMTVVYQKPGLITSHRQVYVPWNGYAVADTLQMLPQDDSATTIIFDGNPATITSHRSTPVQDEFGTRAATVVFSGDNKAFEVDANGAVIRELKTITTRATEFVTPESMPANLPPTSAFTYCAELSVDGAQRVKFAKPLTLWVDNFLGFKVGEIVPVGYYDRDQGAWVPSDNGVVVRLLDLNGDGIVDALDSTGNGVPNDLNGDGSFLDEVKGLNDSTRYVPGATFWRTSVTHFTPWDCNWPYGPPPDTMPPNPEGGPEIDQQFDDEKPDCSTQTNSYIEDRSRIYHEDIPIPGTGMTLHYASNRVRGYTTKITIPVSGATVPASLKRIELEVKVAGRSFTRTLPPLPAQVSAFDWDGLDSLGNPVVGSITAQINIGFVYEAFYYAASGEFIKSFSNVGNNVTGIKARNEITIRKNDERVINVESQRLDLFAEGWSLSGHHLLSPEDTGTLYRGDGTKTKNNSAIITRLTGNSTPNGYGEWGGDNGPAILANVAFPLGLAVDAAGNLYIADSWNDRIRKIDANGIITTVAGGGDYWTGYDYLYDGVPAVESILERPRDVAVDTLGNLYLTLGNLVRKVDANGIIATVAASTEYHILSLAVDAGGNVYFADGRFVRKVGTNGIVTPVAGNGNWSFSGDGGPAIQAGLSPQGVAVDATGNVYISGNNRIRKVDNSGIITTIAGNGNMGFAGDGGPANLANLSNPSDVSVDAVGNLYFADNYSRIRKVNTAGMISTVAGRGFGYGGEGGPAVRALFRGPSGVAVDAAGNLFVSDTSNHRVWKAATSSVFLNSGVSDGIYSTDKNGQGHIFSSIGQHQKTIDLDTGLTLRTFGYDENGGVIRSTDQFGKVLAINRDANGRPSSIDSPDGQTTQFDIDENGNLTRIIYPDGSHYDFEYTSTGLMTVEIDPNGNRFEHHFDAAGRLTDVTDPEGGHWNYTRAEYSNGQVEVKKTTGEGNTTTYLDRTDTTGAYTTTITGPSGGVSTVNISADGLTETSALSCGMNVVSKYDLDPEYKFKYLNEQTESTPAGKKRLTLRAKSYLDTDADKNPDRITENLTVNGKITILLHDVLQAQKEVTSPLGRKVTSFYDPATLLTTRLSVTGLQNIDYGYNEHGRLTSLTQGDRQTLFAYSENGYLAAMSDPEERITYYDTDVMGRVTGIRRPDGSGVGFDYDDNGNMTVLANPAAVTHGFDYNGVDAKAGYTTPLSGSYRYFYDKDRRLVESRFPSGRKIFNLYDKDRLSRVVTPEGDVVLNYLCATKLGSMSKGGETLSYTYDGKLVTAETKSGTLSQTFSYAYNNAFDVSSLTYAGATASFVYDNDGLLTGANGFTIGRNAGNGLPERIYNAAFSLNRTFNGYGEVGGETISVGGLGRFGYSLSRSPFGRIAGKTETVSGTTSNYAYTYDDLGRLISVTKDGALVEQYQYDSVGRRIYEMNSQRDIAGRSFVYSDEDHLVTAGDTAYQYDLDGFLISKTDASGATAYTYSSRGELLKVILPEGEIIEYVHDPRGRRIAKKVNGVIVEKYLWQGLTRLLAVYNGSDSLLMRFLYADGRMPVAMTKGGATYYFGYDQVGSLRVVIDIVGTIVKRIYYDSFGNITADSAPTFAVPFGFAGGLHDRDINLVRFGYRDYDPEIGRWTAKDPIGFNGGNVDVWGYVQNNPVNWIDPYGYIQTQPPLNASPDPGQINRNYEYEPHSDSSLEVPDGSYGQLPYLPDFQGFDPDKLEKFKEEMKDIFKDKENPSCGGGGASMRHELTP